MQFRGILQPIGSRKQGKYWKSRTDLTRGRASANRPCLRKSSPDKRRDGRRSRLHRRQGRRLQVRKIGARLRLGVTLESAKVNILACTINERSVRLSISATETVGFECTSLRRGGIAGVRPRRKGRH
jgi:hypothetical protein